MSSQPLPPADSSNEELSVLIRALRETDQRLEELTKGEVDTVADREGRSFLLQRAQNQLRNTEAAKQSAILSALPAAIALIDSGGFIVSVNEAWRLFAAKTALLSTEYGVGVNYLDVCTRARDDDASDALQAAVGIRSVLGGLTKRFSMEYRSRSRDEQRWYLLAVTPLAADQPNGAVLMHVDVTAERRVEENLRLSESRFRQMAEKISDVFFLQNLDNTQIYYVSPAFEKIWGRSCQSLYEDPASWNASIHPDDRPHALTQFEKVRGTGFDSEYRIVRPDGEIRWIHERGFPITDATGKPYRTAGVAADVTHRHRATLDLRASERRFGDLLRNVQLASVMLDRSASVTFCNDYLLGLTGWSIADVIGQNWYDLFTPPELTEGRADFLSAMLGTSPETSCRESEIVTRSGERRLIRWNNSVLRSGDGTIIGSAGIGEDITERKQAEARIAYLNRVYAMLSDINALIVRVNDRDELYREACRIAVEKGGFRIALMGAVEPGAVNVTLLALAGSDVALITTVRKILTTRGDAPTAMVVEAIKSRKPVISNDTQHDPQVATPAEHAQFGVNSMAVLPLIVAEQTVAVLALYANEHHFFHDEEIKLLTELTNDIAFAIDHIEKGAKLNYLAYYDELTGLANRTLFLDRTVEYLRKADEASHKVGLFMIDLERFRNINDSLGRGAGDQILQQAAQLLTRFVGDANLLTRVSADRFAALLPMVKAGGDLAHLIESRMAAFLNHPFRVQDATFQMSAKVGVAIFPDDGTDADTLLKNAEAALNKAKAIRAGYLFYNQNITATVSAKLTLENQLRRALEKDEFILHYQPKVSLVTGEITGGEALIRWNEPRTGLVPPAEFIPVLEETGLIHAVGRWALRQAIADYLRWRDAGLAVVRIAVNVSPLQLRDRGFIGEVESAIAIDAQAAAGLELEITESLIMEDVNHSIAILQAIRAMNVTIAIDDFGTGFSSLSHLAKLPVHTLKIDRSFILDMTASPQGLALVSTVVSLARSLNLRSVAEGVETLEQSNLLRSLNCDEMQGFLFSRPVPADVFEARFLQPRALLKASG